jgi:hypothetical protein
MAAEDYEKLAKEIVGEFMHGTSLEDGAVKQADALSLNPDQIQNLVQAANTLAHLALMDQKTDGDKVVEFAPADPQVVLKRVYITVTPGDSGAGSCASSHDSNTDFFSDLPKNAVETPDHPANPDSGCGDAAPKNSILIMRIRKVAEELDNKKIAAALEYRETLDKLASEFATVYSPSMQDFEKDAFTVFGDTVSPMLRDLHRCLRLPEKLAGLEKTARVVDADSPQLKLLSRLVKLAEEYEECKAGKAYLVEQIGDLL